MLKTMLKPLFRSKKFLIGFIIFIVIASLGIFGPMFYRVDPTEMAGMFESPPSSENLLGTDTYGRDVLAQLLNGIRSSLYIGIVAALTSLIIGSLVGVIAAVKGGLMDDILMGFTNIVLTTPSILESYKGSIDEFDKQRIRLSFEVGWLQ
ncbi:MAG: peptide/nickel transport system permease protein [Thermotogaceae bacterium]|nr:peptide/nickel transport system permease protein [Thermotogaceae bacterium]